MHIYILRRLHDDDQVNVQIFPSRKIYWGLKCAIKIATREKYEENHQKKNRKAIYLDLKDIFTIYDGETRLWRESQKRNVHRSHHPLKLAANLQCWRAPFRKYSYGHLQSLVVNPINGQLHNSMFDEIYSNLIGFCQNSMKFGRISIYPRIKPDPVASGCRYNWKRAKCGRHLPTFGKFWTRDQRL